MDDTNGDEMLTGNCERCEWYVVKDSYPELVKAYQQHLRGEHPKLWLHR